MTKLTKRIKTTDWWYGNYGENEDEVDAYFTDYTWHGKRVVKFAVWGNDDYALEIEGSTDKDAKRLYELYQQTPDIITQDWCFEHGMTRI